MEDNQPTITPYIQKLQVSNPTLHQMHANVNNRVIPRSNTRRRKSNTKIPTTNQEPYARLLQLPRHITHQGIHQEYAHQSHTLILQTPRHRPTTNTKQLQPNTNTRTQQQKHNQRHNQDHAKHSINTWQGNIVHSCYDRSKSWRNKTLVYSAVIGLLQHRTRRKSLHSRWHNQPSIPDTTTGCTTTRHAQTEDKN